ncbi:MAG: hypothetical protein ACFE0Q_08275 [Anaerolineae bacterium]
MQSRIYYVLLLIVSVLALPAQAQTDDPGALAFQPLQVDNVRLQLDEDEGISLRFNAKPAVCEPLLIELMQDSKYIDITVFAPNSDSPCNTFAPYEGEISLPDLTGESDYVLTLNNFTSTFYLPDADTGADGEPFAVRWGESNDLISFERVVSFVDEAIFSEDDRGRLQVEINGNHPDGCVSQAFTRLMPDPIEPLRFTAETFRLVPESVMCPAVLTFFDTVIPLHELSEGAILHIGDDHYRLDGETVTPVTRDLLTVDTVEILPTANNNIVVVEGQFEQTCDARIESHLRERGFMSLLRIVRYAEANSACDDTPVSYSDDFTVDVLPIVVNSTAYDQDGVIVPPVSSQADNDQGDGNFMQVNTVIESVEVAVLESFPMQLQLQLTISGYQPDGCEFPVEVEQDVDGNDVSLRIYRNVPSATLCPMVLVPYEETITVDGSFEGGTVNIEVNDFSTSVDL